MYNDLWGRSSFARCLIEVNSEADLVDAVPIGIPSLTRDDFTKETIHVVSPPIVTTSNVVTHIVEKTNDGFQTMGRKNRLGKSKSTNGGQLAGPSTDGTSSKKENITMSNSYSDLNDEEEDVEDVYDESANLFLKTKTGGSSSSMAVAGLYNVDVAAIFGVPLTTVGALDVLIKNIEAGEHDVLLYGMTNDKRMEIMNAFGAICDSIEAKNSVPSKSTPSDPIMQPVDINTKATSYAVGASAKDQPKVDSNFCPLVADLIFNGVNISIPLKVIEKEQLGEAWVEKDNDEHQRLFSLNLIHGLD
nr:hypothetical protein [Tanacetum cinerariifolium]